MSKLYVSSAKRGVKSEIKCNLVLGEGRFLIRLLEIMLLLTFPTMGDYCAPARGTMEIMRPKNTLCRQRVA